MPELKWNLTQCRQEQQHNRGMLQPSTPPEEERRELRVWMKRKQRERHAVYQKHRASLQERERKPFTPSQTVVRNGCLFTGTDVVHVKLPNIISTLFNPLQKSATRNGEAREENKRYVQHFCIICAHETHVCKCLCLICRFKLLEQYKQRTSDACSLVRDFATSPPNLRRLSHTEGTPVSSTTRSTSAPPSGKTYRYVLQQ